MVINRVWAMPNRNTFTIKPIKNLIEKYLGVFGLLSKTIIDPFANQSTYGTITNDLNPEYDTDYHMDALDFLKMLDNESADIVLFDPPYSLRQASECYKSFGKERLTRTVTSCKYWSECKIEVARIIKPGGIVISFGWSTNGIGKKRGFKIIEVLIVSHGGSKYDTLVTVEKKQSGGIV
jgi:hypothetical protein